MKIRLLVDAKTLGGIETHILNLCAGLISRQHDCKIVFVCAYPNNPLYGLCQARHLPFTACRTKRELFQMLRDERPNVIHTHGYKANILGRLYGLLTRTKIIATFHSGEKLTGRLRLYLFLDRWTSFLSSNIAINAKIAQEIPSKVTIIPNFVEVPDAPNRLKTQGPFHLYFIGRFNTEKDPLLFGKLSTCIDSGFEWHMVGNGSLLAECEAKFQSSVHFHGLVTDMDILWPDVDMLCLTSRNEGLPLVLLEAMARGIPVVAFDVGSIKDTLTEKAYCIDDHNLSKMAQCILTHFSQPIEIRQDLSQAERSKIKAEFSSQVIIPKIEAVYRDNLN
jgi:glycosyltransferase involved in cell wall biosynthesis